MKEEVWYPSVEDIENIHQQVIRKNPSKYSGDRVNPASRLRPVLRDVRTTPGFYKKAAVLVKRISSEHVFEDRNTTTAILVAKKFLERNNKSFKSQDQQTIGKVANNHGLFTIEELAHYFETGEIDETKLRE